MRLARLLCATALLLALPAHAREFRASDILPPDYPSVQAVVQMDKLLRERSAGRHGITMLEHGDRDSEEEVIADVRSGALDMARISIAALNAGAPETIVPSLPFLFKSVSHARHVLDGPIGEEILAALQAQDLVGLCFYDAGPRSFYSVTRPIRTPADLRGMKVRVQQSDLWSAMMRALGAEPVALPFDRVYANLQSGAIEAADNNWPSYVASRHYTSARYFSLTEHSMAPAVLVFSKRVWDGLTREDQAVIRNAARDSVTAMRGLWDQYESSKLVETASGEIVGDVDRRAFIDVLLPLHATMLSDPKLRGLVRRVQSEE